MSIHAQVLLAGSLEAAKSVCAMLTVEAEYGSTTVQGLRYTAAHHGENYRNPAPCVDQSIPVLKDGDVVLISHIDLDTIGGIARAIEHPVMDRHEFWELAAYVDINGPHKLSQANAKSEYVRALHAYWAWSQSNRGQRFEHDKVHDVTSEVVEHLRVVDEILKGDVELLLQGDNFRIDGERLNEDSFVQLHNAGVIVRFAPSFVNHLYVTPDGQVGDTVVSFNTKTGAITLSFADKDDPRNACQIMQEVLGPAAGGHKGIAGSPRGQRMRLSDLAAVLPAIPMG